MGLGLAIGAISGLASAFGGGKDKVTKSPYENNPWKEQQPYLKDGFAAGKGALDNALSQSGQIKDFTADMTPEQQAAMKARTAAGMDTGALAQAQGQQAMGNISKFADNANGILTDVSGDRTGAHLRTAEQYASNPYLQSQIDASLSDVAKAFGRDQEAINGAAVGTGGINSTRAATLEGLAMDDAMDRAASISSSMRGNAWESGLDRSMATDAQRTGAMLGANGQVGNAGQIGMDASRHGIDAYGAAFDSASAKQIQAQREIDGKRAMTREEMDLISQYMGIVGGNYGSEGFSSSVSQQKSPFQSLMGGAMTGYGWAHDVGLA